MASLCMRCALRRRLQEVSSTRTAARRAFSSSPAKRKGPLPQFTPTSQPELDGILNSLRDKILVPAALGNRERNLIFKDKYANALRENPEFVTIGDEDVQLQHIDRTKDIPSLRREILPKAIEMMANGESEAWNNLPALLTGLKKAKRTPEYRVMGKIARKAIEAGEFRVVLRCLQKPESTQMTLRKPEVLYNVIYALRKTAQDEQWSEAATSKAIRDAHTITMLLEDAEHGSGSELREHDPRTRPDILAVYLELAAVYAVKHQEGKDVDGKVKAYAERVLFNMAALEAKGSTELYSRIKPSSNAPASTGPQREMMRGIPVYHGLRLAIQVLGKEMPNAQLAQRVVSAWETGLTAMADGLKAQATDKAGGKHRWPKSGTYGWTALKAWRSCLPIHE